MNKVTRRINSRNLFLLRFSDEKNEKNEIEEAEKVDESAKIQYIKDIKESKTCLFKNETINVRVTMEVCNDFCPPRGACDYTKDLCKCETEDEDLEKDKNYYSVVETYQGSVTENDVTKNNRVAKFEKIAKTETPETENATSEVTEKDVFCNFRGNYENKKYCIVHCGGEVNCIHRGNDCKCRYESRHLGSDKLKKFSYEVVEENSDEINVTEVIDN